MMEHSLSTYQTKSSGQRGVVGRWRGGRETDHQSLRHPGRSKGLLADLPGCCDQSYLSETPWALQLPCGSQALALKPGQEGLLHQSQVGTL